MRNDLASETCNFREGGVYTYLEILGHVIRKNFYLCPKPSECTPMPKFTTQVWYGWYKRKMYFLNHI